jgi:hypothetical protein
MTLLHGVGLPNSALRFLPLCQIEVSLPFIRTVAAGLQNHSWRDASQYRTCDECMPEVVFVKVLNPRQATGGIERPFHFLESSKYNDTTMS